MCYVWCHEDCVKFDKNLDTRWFVCPPCRGMSHRIHDLENTMSVLLNTVNELATVNAELVSTNERLTNEIRKLNSEQQVRFASLNTIQCQCKSANPGKPHKPDLLIGSSIIRDVVSDDDNKLLVKSHGGAKTHDILKMLTKMKSDEYGDIYIHIASNDCATKKPVPEIVENMDNIIAAAKRVSSSGHVTISGICPRIDDTTAAARGAEVNTREQELAETRGCVRVDHEGTFLCRNGEVNSALLLADGLHLSEAGSKALLKNLDLHSRAHVRLGQGMSARGPSRSSDTLNQAPRRGTSSSATMGSRRPFSPRPTHRANKQNAAWQQERSHDYEQYKRGQRHLHGYTADNHMNNRGPAGNRDTKTEWESREGNRRRNEHYDSGDHRGRQPRCWYCYEPGHTCQQCRHGDYVLCRSCGREGHKSKHCNSERYDY